MSSSKQPKNPRSPNCPPGGSRELELVLSRQFLEDLQHWTGTNAKVAGRLPELVEAARRDPFTRPGKPEPLKALGPGVWSRRITAEHRFVYRVDAGCIYLLQGPPQKPLP